MKEKLHITVLSLGICTLIGMTFAISSRDYKENSPKLNSAPKSTTITKKFVCSAAAVSASSEYTKEYEKNLDLWLLLYNKINALGGNNTTYDDPCDELKGKKKTECNINNLELKSVLRQIKTMEEKLTTYEDCEEKLGLGETEKTVEEKKSSESKKITTTSEKKAGDKSKKEEIDNIKDCGKIDTVGEVDSEQRKVLKCMSDAIITCKPASIDFLDSATDEIFRYTVHKMNNNVCVIGVGDGSLDYRCDIPTQVIQDIKKSAQKNNEDLDLIISPIALLMSTQGGINPETGKNIKLSCKDYSSKTTKGASKWSEGEWSTCTNGKQARTVECQSNGKKVDDKKCTGKKPSVTKVCTNKTEISNKMQFSYPWVASTQSDTVFVGDLAQFTSERGGNYMYSCGTDGIKTISQLNPEGEKHGTFYCVYSSSGEKTATISYQGKIVASRTFIVKEKVEQSTKKADQKKYKCVETDRGLDYEKKGSVTGIWDTYVGDVSDPMYTDTHTDMCLNNYGTTNGLPIGLLEHSCNSQGRKTANHYECTKGCKDGACIK